MIWLSWRQHRKQLLFAVVGLAVIAALMVPTGRQMHDAYATTGLADCVGALRHTEYVPLDDATYRQCASLAERFSARFVKYSPLAILFVFLPLLVGMFFGAPLVAREVEQGTHRLVWTQGVTRLRWTLVKFGLVCAGALALSAAYAALVTWWATPIARATEGRLGNVFFDEQGLVPVAYTLFAVALGVFAGTVWRKTLTAMAITLVGFLAVRGVMAFLVRPRYLPIQTRTFPVAGDSEPNKLAGDWVLTRTVYNAEGDELAANAEIHCGQPGPSPAASAATTPPPGDPCLVTYGSGAYNQQTYQPADRFWLFQYIEAGIFIALAAVLLALAVYQIRRRIS
ncbi:MAG TPA: ABC transporter permease subunit [Pilimelia sp.]|nr:ABC transporter permease subunit [Pilimelia sp.]